MLRSPRASAVNWRAWRRNCCDHQGGAAKVEPPFWAVSFIDTPRARKQRVLARQACCGWRQRGMIEKFALIGWSIEGKRAGVNRVWSSLHIADLGQDELRAALQAADQAREGVVVWRPYRGCRSQSLAPRPGYERPGLRPEELHGSHQNTNVPACAFTRGDDWFSNSGTCMGRALLAGFPTWKEGWAQSSVENSQVRRPRAITS